MLPTLPENPARRVYEHKHKMVEGFTSKYGTDKLGYYETSYNIVSAIEREKQIKGGSRKKKLAATTQNPPSLRAAVKQSSLFAPDCQIFVWIASSQAPRKDETVRLALLSEQLQLALIESINPEWKDLYETII